MILHVKYFIPNKTETNIKIQRIAYVTERASAIEGKSPDVQVVNDINTLSLQEDPEANFAADNIGAFFATIPNHLEKCLSTIH